MKYLILLLFITLTSISSYSQVTTNVTFKDEKGIAINFKKYHELRNSGDWVIGPIKKDKNGTVTSIQLKKASEADKQFAKQMVLYNKWLEKTLGTKAPKFNFTDINGNTISSENTTGKVVVLNFWFTTCPPCIEEIPAINDIYKKYKKNLDVVFASITFNKSEKVNSFIEKHPILLPMVIENREAAKTFNVQGYPTNLVIGMDGNYLAYLNGGRPNIYSLLDREITNALDQK